MSLYITPKTKVREIKQNAVLQAEEVRGFKTGGPFGFLVQRYTVAGMNTLFNPDDSESIIRGYNAIIRAHVEGVRVCRYIYSDEEVQADKTRSEVLLYYFPLIADDDKQPVERRPFVLICPGGGYGGVISMWEGYPVAERVNQAGYPAFVLRYRSGKAARYPHPQEDLACALRYIREHADALGVLPDAYCLMGFDAGGHLAASFGLESCGYAHYGLSRPGAVVLGYPILSMEGAKHQHARDNLLGKRPDPGLVQSLSIPPNVSKTFPPTFLWQYQDDELSPLTYAAALKTALEAAAVPCSVSAYPGNKHSQSLAIGGEAEDWFDEAIEFWEDVQKP
jgi:acetyl esterase/lipase